MPVNTFDSMAQSAFRIASADPNNYEDAIGKIAKMVARNMLERFDVIKKTGKCGSTTEVLAEMLRQAQERVDTPLKKPDLF